MAELLARQALRSLQEISEVYKLARIQHDSAGSVAEDVRQRLLESEYKTIREIRMILSLARLGPGGQDDYLNKVMTESSASDFAAMFHDKSAFKIYKKALTSVPKTRKRSYFVRSARGSGSSRRRYSNSNFRRGRSSHASARSSRSSRKSTANRARSSVSDSSRSSTKPEDKRCRV